MLHWKARTPARPPQPRARLGAPGKSQTVCQRRAAAPGMPLPPGLALPAHSSSPAGRPRAGSSRPARKTALPGPAARGSRESLATPPGSCHRGPPGVWPWTVQVPARRATPPPRPRARPAPSVPIGPAEPGPQPEVGALSPGPHSIPPPLPAGLRRLPPPPPPPSPARTPARQRHPAASRSLTPSSASCAPPRPAANFLRPTSELAGRPDGQAETERGRERRPRRAAGPRPDPPTARTWGSHRGRARPTPPGMGFGPGTRPPPTPGPTGTPPPRPGPRPRRRRAAPPPGEGPPRRRVTPGAAQIGRASCRERV